MSLPRRGLLHLREIARFRHLVRYLVTSSLRTENTGTIFGFFWWLLDPLLLMAVYSVLVAVILRRGSHAYPVFVLIALVPWEFFAGSARASMIQTLTKERAMRQVAFPKGVIPLAATLAGAVHFAFAVVVLIAFATPFGIYPSAVTPLVVPIALVQLVFTLGVAYLLAALNVLFRDTGHLTNYVFRLWFYLSPALYPVTMIPDRYRPYFHINPFTTFFTSYRDVLMDNQLPSATALGALAAVSVALLVIGYGYFVWAEPTFAKVN